MAGYKIFVVYRKMEGKIATVTITFKEKAGWGAAAQSLGRGLLLAQALGDSAMLWPPAASALPSAEAAGTGGLFSDPLFFPISI